MYDGRFRRRGKLKIPRGTALLLAFLLLMLAALPGAAQTITLKAVKSPADSGVRLIWLAAGSDRYEVDESQVKDFSSPSPLGKTCFQTYLNAGVLPDGLKHFYRIVTTAPDLGANAGNDASICQGGSGAAIGGQPSTATGGTPPYTYSWSPPTGLDDASAANPLANPAATTSYTVTATDAEGCMATDSVTVTVAGSGSVMAEAGDPQQICSGGAGSRIGGTPTASGGQAPYTYSWNPAMGLDDATAANPVASPAATTAYTVTVTDAQGCKATDTVTVTVSTSGAVFAEAGADARFCEGQGPAPIGGSPTASGGSGNYTYLWAPPIGLSATDVANPAADPVGTTIYEVTVTDTTSGCTAKDTVTVKVNPNVIADAGPDDYVCKVWHNTEHPVVLGGSPSGSGGTPPIGYSWSPGTNLSSATDPNPTVQGLLATTDFMLSLVDNEGCTSNDLVHIRYKPAEDKAANCDKTPPNYGINVGQCGRPFTQLTAENTPFKIWDQWCKVILVTFSAGW